MKISAIPLFVIFIVISANICVYCESDPTAESTSTKEVFPAIITSEAGNLSPEAVTQGISKEQAAETAVSTEEVKGGTVTEEGKVTEETKVVTEEIKTVTEETITVTKEAETMTREVIPEEKINFFTDVPEDHWALDSVNKLVKMGVTQGYPDGTFRGREEITRYEMAIFLSKMAHKERMKRAINEKILEELKAEVYKLRYTVDMYKKGPDKTGPINGSFGARIRMGNLITANAANPSVAAPIGPVLDYRLITSYLQEFKGGSYIRLNIDTMDSGFSNPRDLVREMFDFEAGLETPYMMGIKVTAGPGTIVHRETTNIFPSEDYTVYLRPDNSIAVEYDNGYFDTGIQYKATQISTSGVVSVHDVNYYLWYKLGETFLGNIKLGYSMDYYTNDLRATDATMESTINMYNAIIKVNAFHEVGLKLGVSSDLDPTGKTFFGGYYVAKDLIGQGSNLAVSLNRTGDTFLNASGNLKQDDILGVNVFNKFYKNGTYDFGLEISQKIGEGRTFRGKAGAVLNGEGRYDGTVPDAEAAVEANLDFGVLDDAVMTIGYRVYQKPSLLTNITSDMIGIAFNYKF